MKLGIVSHTAIDHIVSNNKEEVTVGGPTYYAGLTIKQFGLNLALMTKVGYDFKYTYLPIDNRYRVDDAPTTRFRLFINNYSRRLFLLARCKDIEVDDIVDTDCCIVSPIINEINNNVFKHIIKRSSIRLLDPQGFVRVVKNNECYIERREIDIQEIDIIKVDENEAYALTGLHGIDALKRLKTKISILTDKDKSLMLCNDKLYSIEFESIKSIDSTGIGDIFMGIYAVYYMKEKDPILALAGGVAGALLALKNNRFGIDKIPNKDMIEKKTEELYNKIHLYKSL